MNRTVLQNAVAELDAQIASLTHARRALMKTLGTPEVAAVKAAPRKPRKSRRTSVFSKPPVINPHTGQSWTPGYGAPPKWVATVRAEQNGAAHAEPSF